MNVYKLKACILCSKNYRRIRSKLNEMCNRKTRVPAGVKNSFWRVDERALSTAVRAGDLGWPCLRCSALLDTRVNCDNVDASCKKGR